MPRYEEISKQADLIRQVILVCVGAGLNFSIAYYFLVSVIEFLAANQVGTASPLTQSSVIILTASYFVFGIAYATFASLLFSPKRIISPLQVQMVTFVLVPILEVLVYFQSSSNPNLVVVSLVVFILSFFAFVFFYAAGAVQSRIVAFLVGLSGTADDISTFELTVGSNIESALRVLRRKEVRGALDLVHEEEDDEIGHIFHTAGSDVNQFVLVLRKDPHDTDRTELIGMCFEQRSFAMFKTPKAVEHCKMRKAYVASTLSDGNILWWEASGLSALPQSLSYALKPTWPRILAFTGQPRIHRLRVFGLLGVFALVALLGGIGVLSLELTATFLFFTGLAVLTDILPTLGGRRQ